MRGRYVEKSKYTRLLMAVSVFLCVIVVGVTIAYMFRVTDPIQNTFEPATVSCEVVESFNQTTGIKSSIAVKNTGNIPAFVRVRLVSYWVDQTGSIIAEVAEAPSFAVAEGWINEGNGIYRYNTPMEPNETTPNMLDSSIYLQTDGDNRQVIEVLAEAIQTGAVSEWS